MYSTVWQFTKCLGGRSSPSQASERVSPMPQEQRPDSPMAMVTLTVSVFVFP